MKSSSQAPRGTGARLKLPASSRERDRLGVPRRQRSQRRKRKSSSCLPSPCLSWLHPPERCPPVSAALIHLAPGEDSGLVLAPLWTAQGAVFQTLVWPRRAETKVPGRQIARKPPNSRQEGLLERKERSEWGRGECSMGERKRKGRVSLEEPFEFISANRRASNRRRRPRRDPGSARGRGSRNRAGCGWQGTAHGARRPGGGWFHAPSPTARSPGRRGVSSRGGGASSLAPRGSALTQQPTSGPRSPSAGRCRSHRPQGAPGPEAGPLHHRALSGSCTPLSGARFLGAFEGLRAMMRR